MYMQNNNFLPYYYSFYILRSPESSDYYEEKLINFIHIFSNLWPWYNISINGDFRISIIVTDITGKEIKTRSNSTKNPVAPNVSNESCPLLYLVMFYTVAYADDFFEATFFMLWCLTSSAVLQDVRSWLMTWRKNVKPLYSCLNTLPVIYVPHFYMGSAWQSQIHTLPLPATGRGLEKQILCCKRLYGWMCGLRHQTDVWVAPVLLPLS